MLKTILILVPIVLTALALMLIVQNSRMPVNLGVSAGRLAPLPATPNAVSSQTDQKKQQVDPLPFIGDLQQTKQTLLLAIDSYPGKSQVISATDTYIHCVFSTPRLRFKDDVEFFLDAGDRLVHFRSASRSGYSDRGMNRKRYEELASLYLRGNLPAQK